MTTTTRETTVERDGLRFELREAGPDDGVPVLLLHGFPQTADAWSAQLTALGEAGYRAIAPDQRGYSPLARPRGRRAYRLEELVADTMAFVDATGAERVHLVGHDWGGAVAWAFASAHPDRLRTLTVLSTPHQSAFTRSLLGTQALRSWYMGFFQVPFVPDRLVPLLLERGLRRSGLPREYADRYVARVREPGAMTAALTWYRAAATGSSVPVGRITVPTMYVWSTDDAVLGRPAAERTGDFVDGPYRFEVLEGVNHWISETVPEELNRLLLDQLSGY